MRSLVSFSGTSMKISGALAIAERLKTNRYDCFAGISGGAILAFLLCHNKLQSLHDTLFDKKFSVNSFFDYDPMGFRGVLNLLSFRDGAAPMGNLYKLLENTVSYTEFHMNKKPIYIGCVDIDTGRLFTYNINHFDYATALKIIVASSTIPVFSKPVEINDNGTKRKLVDGGLMSHNIEVDLLLMYNFKVVDTVYSYLEPGMRQPLKKAFNWFNILNNTMAIMSREISDNDDKLAERICKDNDIIRTEYRFKAVTEGFYDTKTIKEQYDEGVKAYERLA